MNSASRMMMGSGIPINHSNMPLPKPMAFSSGYVCCITNVPSQRKFRPSGCDARGSAARPAVGKQKSPAEAGLFWLPARRNGGAGVGRRRLRRDNADEADMFPRKRATRANNDTAVATESGVRA
jgi:hypothetical protein